MSVHIAVIKILEMDRERDRQLRPPRKRRIRIGGQYVSGHTTEQININVPTSLDQQESNLQRPGEGTSFEDEKDKSSDDDHQDCNSAKNHLAVYSPADTAFDGIECRHSQNQAHHIGPSVGGFTAKEQININVPTSLDQQESSLRRPGEGTSFEDEKDKSSDDDHQDCNNAQNHLGVYSPADTAFDGIECRHSQNQAYHIGPSVGTFTVQCSICFKWRFLPSKEKFEEIREHISDHPFVCAAAREWRPEISCNDDSDITQDGSRLWAIERPNIPRPPPGWERLLKIRGSGGARFADVYYITPSGKRLRSKVEVQRYLLEHPDEAEGVALSRFSFLIPTPLQTTV